MRGTRINRIFKLLIWGTVILLPLIGQGQVSNIDSLEQVLDSSIESTERLEILDELYDHYVDKDLEKSLDLVYQIQTTASASNSEKYICKGYYYLGTVHRMMNVAIDTVLQDFEIALNCCESIGDDECLSKVHRGIGSVYHRNGLLVEAMASYKQSLELSTAKKDTLSMIACLANIGGLLKQRGDYQKSLKYAKQALAYAERVNHRLYIGKITNNIGNIYTKLGILDTALILYEKALEVKREEGSELSLVITLANIGAIHINKGRYELGNNYLEEAYDIATKENYPYGIVLSLEYLASSAYEQGNYEEAIRLSREGLVFFKSRSANEFIKNFHDVIGNSFEELNKLDSALVHFRIAQEVNDSIFQLEKDEQIQQLELGYQVKQKDIENQLLKTEQSFTQQKLKTRTYLSVGLIIALFLAFGWGYSLYRNIQVKKRANTLLETQVKERTNDLEVANQQLKQANYELKSFNHIASHDLKEPIRNVGNYIGLIFKRLPQETKVETQDYFDIISQSTSQLYTLLEDISTYSNLSQGVALKNSLVDLEATVLTIKTGLDSVLETKQGQVIYQNLPSIHSNSSLVFLALKNLVENGMKFNESANPRVEICYQALDATHQIVISDNGIGIDPRFQEQVFTMFKRLHSIDQYEGSGIGLAIAKLAVEKLGGTIEIESQIGQGSKFTIQLPKQETSHNS